MPIGARLTLGFILAALIATIAASLIGFLRSEALNRQSNFYQKLLQTNTSLTTGANFLQLMNTETHTLLDDASVPQPSKETLTQDRNAIQGLATRYNGILNAYIGQDLLKKHANEMALLAEGGNEGQADQQLTLAGSALRAWQVYRTAQDLVIQDISRGNLAQVQRFMRVQVEPTNADALSALRALIQLDQRLAASVHDAADAEVQSQLITTIAGVTIAFIAIVLVGWFISSTIVRRLRQLRYVTQSVEQGQLDARVSVIGRDEIADVSASVNAMLEAIVGLLEETRHQRDVLTNAAEHLFSDMRVVSAGDLRVNAPVSNDPIGMLANAFNFTVGRFRRFVLRIQTTVEQLDVLSRQGLERAESFAQGLNMHANLAGDSVSQPSGVSWQKHRTEVREIHVPDNPEHEVATLAMQVQRARERLQKLSKEDFNQRARTIHALAEQMSHLLERIRKMLSSEMPGMSGVSGGRATGGLAQMYLQELRMLESLHQRMLIELQTTQQNTSKSFSELDETMMVLANRMRLLKTSTATPAQVNPDVVRQGIGFANDVTVIAHHIADLAQEMRTGIVSFQFDTHDVNIGSVNQSQSLQAPVNYRLPAGEFPEPGRSGPTARRSRNLV
jgi:methyl-accepting chemotaxis protein